MIVKSTEYPFDYNKNNPMEGFNNWARYIHIENNKLLNSAPSKKYLRQRELIDTAIENHQTGPKEMIELFEKFKNIINK